MRRIASKHPAYPDPLPTHRVRLRPVHAPRTGRTFFRAGHIDREDGSCGCAGSSPRSSASAAFARMQTEGDPMTKNRSKHHELSTPRASEDAQFEADLIEAIAFLKSFARTLARNAETADDLVQDTLLNAWRARASYKPDTNLKAWLCTILRNKFYSDGRRAWRQMPWDQEAAERIVGQDAGQASAVELSDTVHAMEIM